jgi:hypothetical protein
MQLKGSQLDDSSDSSDEEGHYLGTETKHDGGNGLLRSRTSSMSLANKDKDAIIKDENIN